MLARLETFQPQLVITDLRMDGTDGMAFFRLLHFEREYLVQLLRTTQGITRAAQLAKRERSKFYHLLRRHQLDPELFRTGFES